MSCSQGVVSAHAKTQHGIRESQYLSISKIFLYLKYICKYNVILILIFIVMFLPRVFVQEHLREGSEELQKRHRCTLHCQFEPLYRAATIIELMNENNLFVRGSGFGISKYLMDF